MGYSSLHPSDFDLLQGPTSFPVYGKEATGEMHNRSKTIAVSRKKARYMPWLAGIIGEMVEGGKPL